MYNINIQLGCLPNLILLQIIFLKVYISDMFEILKNDK